MTETTPGRSPRTFEVGPDRVTISDTEAVIETRHPMPDWDVREINHVPVYVEEKKYFLVQKRKADAPYAVRYLLQPWPEYQATNANGFHAYDAEVVNAREAQFRSGHVDEIGHAFILPLYPVLGFLWSGLQKRLIRFGFVPRSITGFSIFITFALIFGQAVFTLILLSSSLRVGQVLIGGFIRAIAPSDHLMLGPLTVPVGLLDLLLLVALIVDTLVRYSLYLRDEEWAGGFFEWIVPRRKPGVAAAR